MSSHKKNIKKFAGVIVIILLLSISFILSGQNGIESNTITSHIINRITGEDKPGFKGKHIKLKKENNLIQGYYSNNGTSWYEIGESLKMDMKDTVYVGMAVTAHNNKALCKAEFDNIKLETGSRDLQNDEWKSSDIGIVGITGFSNNNNGIYEVAGSGNDIWRGADGFYYVYKQIKGDFSISARIISIENTDEWAKAGLQIRESLNPQSKFVDIIMTPEELISLQWREEKEPQLVVKYKTELTNLLFRKTLHFFGYFILALVVFWTLREFNFKRNTSLVSAFLACSALALLDEYHQSFVPNRGSGVRDVLVDTAGVALGVLIIYVIDKFKSENKQRDGNSTV